MLTEQVRMHAENGPFKINKDLSLRESDYGWDKAHNMIFVDQPIGTGFSYSDSPDDAVYGEKGAPPRPAQRMPLCPSGTHPCSHSKAYVRAGVAADMLGFMQDFYAAHPEFQSNDLFIVGESYAGHYVPAVAHALWEWNEKNATADTRVNIKGLAIGVHSALRPRLACVQKRCQPAPSPERTSLSGAAVVCIALSSGVT